MRGAAALALCALAVLLAAAALYRTPGQPRGEFAGVSLRLEYATTSAERALGLGGRAEVPPNYGMLFVFPQAGEWGFWMKDMRVPLDLFWLDGAGRVIWMEQGVATDTYPDVFYPPAPAQYVLETAAGFAAEHRVATGTPLALPAWPNAAP
jgi:uncharacterized membrane protein (UPF0127 family)